MEGRVARLMSHAPLLESLGTGATWSVARGLRGNVEAYKRRLAACEQARRNDPDDRGQPSEKPLMAFFECSLRAWIDLVDFTECLIEPTQTDGCTAKAV
jgi:hypothetical protein